MNTMLCTRPDVIISLNVSSRFHSNFGVEHWEVVKNILKYLRSTKDMFLVNGEGDLQDTMMGSWW